MRNNPEYGYLIGRQRLREGDNREGREGMRQWHMCLIVWISLLFYLVVACDPMCPCRDLVEIVSVRRMCPFSWFGILGY